MPKHPQLITRSERSKSARDRARRPVVEGLEQRLLLYSALGDKWTYDSRITYSLMPDGTSVGGVPSVLFQTLNQIAPTATWQQQIERAATLWENATNINLAQVPDGGEPVGTAGNQQDDPRFGDIRIGSIPLSAGVLAITFVPPPNNGGTDAGDILLNSTVNWQINSNYDLMTVVAHEFGHALGLGDESTDPAAEMYGTYDGIKQILDSDDIAGIQSIYGTRQFDVFNSGSTRDNSPFSATILNSRIGGNGQIAIPGLDITTAGDSEWFYVNVPPTTTGKMTVTVQSSNLSSLSPQLQVYSSSLSLIGLAAAPNSMGATISVTDNNVWCGQGYFIKVLAANGYGALGGYGLLVNFGSQPQAPMPPPNTVVASEPDLAIGAATADLLAGSQTSAGGNWTGGALWFGSTLASLGNLTGWAQGMTVSSPGSGGSPGNAPTQSAGDTVLSLLLCAWNAVLTTGQNNAQLPSLAGVYSAPAPTIAAPLAAGPAPVVLQALDTVLGEWSSTSQSDLNS
jgi:hypothetical protein